MEKKVVALYWSATGNTKKVVTFLGESLAAYLKWKLEMIDFTSFEARKKEYDFSPEDIVIIGSPTYAGKLPNKILPDFKGKLHLNGALGIGIVTYGNRNYDHSLAELCSVVEENHGCMIAGAAIPCQHSFSSKLANGRPDEEDLKGIRDFAKKVADVIVTYGNRDNPQSTIKSVASFLPGNADAPYYTPLGEDGTQAVFLKAKPITELERCSGCGRCATVCPMNSIHCENVAEVTGICIKCQACIQECPSNAKKFEDEAFLSHVRMLEKMDTGKKEQEYYIVDIADENVN